MKMDKLSKAVYEANMALERENLVTLTWGNVSGIDRDSGVVVIKPSGVAYDKLKPGSMVAVDLDGRRLDGGLKPSSDTPTHAALYKAFPHIGGICHTHSPYATAFAQACREIPCLGTTHADHFRGAVPLARALTREEVHENYEANTGKVIIERFTKLDPCEVPGVLCAHHGPFTWGNSPAQATENSIALEVIARMALQTLQLEPHSIPLPQHIQDVHFLRKHGPGATYGQELK